MPALRFDPLLPLLPLAGVIVVYLGALLLFYRGFSGIVSRRFWYALLGAKLMSAVVLALVLLNPYLLRQRPDDRTFRVVTLADATGSMNTRDCDGSSRLAVVQNQVLAPESPFQQRVLAQYANVQSYIFANDDLHRLTPGSAFTTLPGETDIDGALANTLADARRGADDLAAVVVVTDGLDNRGEPLLAAARAFQQAGVPIHCIGVGDRRQRADLGVAWKQVPKRGTKGKDVALTARITRNFTGAAAVRASLTEGGRVLRTVTTTFDEATQSRDVVFNITPFTAGFKTYKVEVAPDEDEQNTLNNADFTGVDVRNPEVFRVFYFDASPGWDYKFLRLLAADQEKLRFDAVLRLGEDTFFVRGTDADAEREPTEPGLPPATELNEYDCLVINLNALYMLDADGLRSLADFVEFRGGGIVFTGIADAVPDEIAALLPAQRMAPYAAADEAPLSFGRSQVFSRLRGRMLDTLSDKLYVPGGATVFELLADDLKPGAIPAVTTETPPRVVLAVQNYGSGKVALLNLADSWKWSMRLEGGERFFGLFWGNLIAWISSSSREQLTVRPAPGKVLLREPLEVSVDVLDGTYRSDNGATVTCQISTPAGEELALPLFADARVDGRYTGTFVPRETGQHQFHIRAQPSHGAAMEAVSEYLAVDLSPESQPHPLAEAPLQALARQTGGEYWHFRDIEQIRKLPLTEQLRFLDERRNLLSTWWFLVAAVLALLPDWILRRRIGLR
jgi:hypothetical protein